MGGERKGLCCGRVAEQAKVMCCCMSAIFDSCFETEDGGGKIGWAGCGSFALAGSRKGHTY